MGPPPPRVICALRSFEVTTVPFESERFPPYPRRSGRCSPFIAGAKGGPRVGRWGLAPEKGRSGAAGPSAGKGGPMPALAGPSCPSLRERGL